jgi:hypothetical protein
LLSGAQQACTRVSRRLQTWCLIQPASISGHDPYADLKDVLERLPTQPASRVEELLPHRWKPLPPHPDTDHQRAGVLA